jgi:hypothetical protein
MPETVAFSGASTVEDTLVTGEAHQDDLSGGDATPEAVVLHNDLLEALKR